MHNPRYAWELGATPRFEDDQNCGQASPDSQISTVVVGPSAKSGDAVSWVLLYSSVSGTTSIVLSQTHYLVLGCISVDKQGVTGSKGNLETTAGRLHVEK